MSGVHPRLNVRTTYHAAHMLNRGIMSSLPASKHALLREGRLTHGTGLPALSACHCCTQLTLTTVLWPAGVLPLV